MAMPAVSPEERRECEFCAVAVDVFECLLMADADAGDEETVTDVTEAVMDVK